MALSTRVRSQQGSTRVADDRWVALGLKLAFLSLVCVFGLCATSAARSFTDYTFDDIRARSYSSAAVSLPTSGASGSVIVLGLLADGSYVKLEVAWTASVGAGARVAQYSISRGMTYSAQGKEGRVFSSSVLRPGTRYSLKTGQAAADGEVTFGADVPAYSVTTITYTLLPQGGAKLCLPESGSTASGSAGPSTSAIRLVNRSPSYKRATAYLYVDGDYRATLFISGDAQYISASFPISAGKHLIQVKASGGPYENWEEEIEVAEGEERVREFSLKLVAQAVFTFSPTPPTAGEPVQFDATASAGELLVEYAWDWDADGTYDLRTSTAQAEHTFAPGQSYYAVVLQVTDQDGRTDSVAQVVTMAGSVAGPPVAAFEFRPPAPGDDLAVTFDGSASSDAEGEVDAWTWDFGDGSALRTERSGAPFTHVYDSAGTYSVTLTVTDKEGLSGSASQVVAVPEDANLSPTAGYTWQVLSSGGARVAVEPREGDGIRFDASTSSDRDGTIASYEWDWESDGTFDLKAPAAVAEHAFPSSGPQQVTLRVTDDLGATGETTETISITARQLPQATFAFLPSTPTVLDSVQFSNQTTDADGQVVSWTWDFGDGTTSADRNPTHTYSETGFFVVTLSVTNSDGLTGIRSESVRILNLVPTAGYTWQVLSSGGARVAVEPREGDGIRFDASTSSDRDGTIASYEWDWESDGTFDLKTPAAVAEHAFPSSGPQQVTLRVTDDLGATGEMTGAISISARQLPQAAFAFLPSSPTVLDSVQFSDQSTDADGQVVSWTWDFGDGTTSADRNPTHTYSQTGFFVIALSITDSDGLAGARSESLRIANLPPQGSFAWAPGWPGVGRQVEFDASGSTDRDGEIAVYAWDFESDGKTDASGGQASWTFPEAKDYSVTLTLTDDEGATATTTQAVTVVAASSAGPPRFANLWGLVVGVAQYEDPGINDLEFTEQDAQAFYQFLISTRGGGFPKENVRLLLGAQATQRSVQAGFGWLIKAAGRDDLVVVYFAGHGSYAPDLNGDEADGFDEYLIPYDAEHDDLFSTAIRDDEVGDWLTSLKSRHTLLVFDSCFAGGATRTVRGFEQTGTRAGPGNQVFSDLLGAGRLVLAASQESEPSYETPKLSHGVFTYFLLRGLGALEGVPSPQADTDQDGRVTVEELKAYLELEVPKYIRDEMQERPQHPLVSGDPTLTRIALTGYGEPLVGEVTALQGEYVIISLGTRHGVQVGDRFEVVRSYALPGGSSVIEVRAVIEAVALLGPERAVCAITELHFPVEIHDAVRPAT